MKKSSIFSRGIDTQTLRIYFLLTTLEGIVSLLVLLSLPKSTEGAWLFGYSLNRVILISGMIFVSLGLLWFTVNLRRKPEWDEKLRSQIESLTQRKQTFDLVLTVLSALFVIVVFLLFLWGITKDTYYLAYLIRFGPILVFISLVIVQTLALFFLKAEERAVWFWSLLFGSVLIILQEWPLIVTNKLGNVFLVLGMLSATLYAQVVFRLSFHQPFKHKLSWLIGIVLAWPLIYMEFFFIPKKFLSHLETFYILSPILMVGLAVSAHFVHWFFPIVSKNLIIRILIALFIFAGFIYIGNLYYAAGTAQAEQVNTTYEPYDDELAYMQFAINARESNFRYTGTRNQMPLYPDLQALFYKPSMSLDEFFAQGKQLNILLSLISLAIIFLVMQRFLSLGEAISLTLVTAFGLYVLKSGYFMVELLYYTLSFFAYLLMIILLIKPSVKLGITAGILLGIAHLAKASILPGLVLFVGIFLFKELIIFLWQRRDKSRNEPEEPTLKLRLISLSLVVLCFLVVVFPYLAESKRIYGSYFYNVNSTFYMWYDDYDEATQGTISHGDGYHWPDMPPEDIPSPIKYFKEHNLSQIQERIRYGLHWQYENIRYQYSFFNYPIFFLVFALFVFLLDIKTSMQVLKKYWHVALFAFSYFMAYFILYVWYSAISSLPRFLYALWLPLVFSLYMAVRALSSEKNRPLVKMTGLAILTMALIDIWYIVSWGPFFRDFGS